jgi:hypothetical protein
MMKNAFKPTAIFLILLSTLFSCKKKVDDAKDFTIDGQNLTDCPQGTTCNFQYVDYASMMGNQLTFTSGQYRVFWARNENNNTTSWLYFQAPMISDKFLLNDADIVAGRIKYVSGCSSCNTINAIKVLTGTVKGIRVINSSNEPAKWLLESNIVLTVEGSTIPIDTLYFKEYYYPAIQ